MASEAEVARVRAWGSAFPTSSAASSVLVPEVVETDEGTLRKIVSYTKTYHVDRYYEAMVGPHSNMRVSLHQGRRDAAPELLWVKGISAEIVDETGTPLSQEYTCHVVASIASMREHNEALGLVARDPRLTALTLRNHQGADADRWLHLNHPDMAENFVDANGDGRVDGGFVKAIYSE